MTVTAADTHINYQRIEKAIAFLESNFRRQPSLEEIAEHVNLSPFHFQRLFTEWAGISPKRFLQFLTVEFLKERLSEYRSIMEAAEVTGLSSQSRVYDLFITLEAVTPQEYRERGKGIAIQFGVDNTPFGRALIGISPRGISWMSFLDNESDESIAVEEMKSAWRNATFTRNDGLASQMLRSVFAPGLPAKLHLLVKGTNFQVKVWEALLRIPEGHLATYQDIASFINCPNALQAVGSAVGANHIAYLIPCHRVIRKSGIPGEYRWQSTRKKSLIAWEMSRAFKDQTLV